MNQCFLESMHTLAERRQRGTKEHVHRGLKFNVHHVDNCAVASVGEF